MNTSNSSNFWQNKYSRTFFFFFFFFFFTFLLIKPCIFSLVTFCCSNSKETALHVGWKRIFQIFWHPSMVIFSKSKFWKSILLTSLNEPKCTLFQLMLWSLDENAVNTLGEACAQGVDIWRPPPKWHDDSPSNRKASVNIWRLTSGGLETLVALWGSSGGRPSLHWSFIRRQTKKPVIRSLVRVDSEAAKHEQSLLQIIICFNPLSVLNTSGWQKPPCMKVKFIINTSDAERGQEMGSANGYETAKYEPECVSCLLANKHIISQKCTMVSSRPGWSPLQRVPGLL